MLGVVCEIYEEHVLKYVPITMCSVFSNCCLLCPVSIKLCLYHNDWPSSEWITLLPCHIGYSLHSYWLLCSYFYFDRTHMNLPHFRGVSSFFVYKHCVPPKRRVQVLIGSGGNFLYIIQGKSDRATQYSKFVLCLGHWYLKW